MTAVTLSERRFSRTWLAVVATVAAGAALSGAVVAFDSLEAESTLLKPLEYRLPDGPRGVITYFVLGGEAISVSATGGHVQDVHAITPRQRDSASEKYLSPDGSSSAEVRRLTDGSVNLTIAFRDRIGTWGLAGPNDPALVKGGKAPAAAVKGVPLTVAWSPDSKYLAWGSITGEPFTLHVYPLQAADYPLNGGYVGELAWSPDARYLAISTYTLDRKHHSVFIWDSQGLQLPQHLSDGCHITWSPDSRYIAIHRDPDREPGTWVLSADGSYRQQLAADPESFPAEWTTG